MEARPFIKIAGGKRGLLYRLTEIAPPKIGTYFEPFVGGGALFWALANAGRFKRAVLVDRSEELVRTWRAIQRNHVGVLRELDKHVHTREHYEEARLWNRKALSDEQCAAWMIFTNRAGFNGLYRVNAAGEFNVPFGKQPKMDQFIDPQVLKACARVLDSAKVEIICGDFEEVMRKQRRAGTSFTYYDSPYAPVSKTSSFTGYQAGGFKTEDQERLAKLFREMNDDGEMALLSNSSCDLTDKLYRRLPIERIMAKRAINSDPTKRGAVKEILVATKALREAVRARRR